MDTPAHCDGVKEMHKIRKPEITRELLPSKPQASERPTPGRKTVAKVDKKRRRGRRNASNDESNSRKTRKKEIFSLKALDKEKVGVLGELYDHDHQECIKAKERAAMMAFENEMGVINGYNGPNRDLPDPQMKLLSFLESLSPVRMDESDEDWCVPPPASPSSLRRALSHNMWIR